MTTKRKRYDAKFKQEIVKLVLDGRKTVQEVCQTHELHESSVYNWVREAKRIARMTPDERLAQQEREELERLRRENKELKRERDFLRDAATYFAKVKK